MQKRYCTQLYQPPTAVLNLAPPTHLKKRPLLPFSYLGLNS
ncbi:MAG: hypothetical protein AAF614_36650 [Chloroflexota bacterium]